MKRLLLIIVCFSAIKLNSIEFGCGDGSMVLISENGHIWTTLPEIVPQKPIFNEILTETEQKKAEEVADELYAQIKIKFKEKSDDVVSFLNQYWPAGPFPHEIREKFTDEEFQYIYENFIQKLFNNKELSQDQIHKIFKLIKKKLRSKL